MFPKDSLILLSPPKFYPPHPLVCCKFSKVAWIRFRDRVRGVGVPSCSPGKSGFRQAGLNLATENAGIDQAYKPGLCYLTASVIQSPTHVVNGILCIFGVIMD